MVKTYLQEQTIPKLKEGAKQYRELRKSEKYDLKFQRDSEKITKEALKEKYPDGLCNHCKYYLNSNHCSWEKAIPSKKIKKLLSEKEVINGKVMFCEVFLLGKKDIKFI